jgi:prolyl 4-hydroxylase
MMSQASQQITPQLCQWIQAQISAGFSREVILRSMKQSGWHDEVALQAFQSMLPEPSREPAPVVSPGVLPGPDLSRSPVVLDAGDRSVQVVMSMTCPRVVVFDGLLDDQECAALIEGARARLARSRTVQRQTGGEEVHESRTSEGMFYRRGENEVVRRIEQRIARLLNWPLENGEGLQILHYGPGAQYKPHYDYFEPAAAGSSNILQRGGQRVGTLVMYLNNPAKGGGTTFPDVGLEVAPRQGSAVFFSYDRPSPETRSLHGGAPVIEGEKWVATKWLRQGTFV